MMEIDEEFDSSWDRAWHWNESDLPSFSSTEDDQDMSVETMMFVSDGGGFDDDNNGDIGDMLDLDDDRDNDEERGLDEILLVILLFVFGYDPLSGDFPFVLTRFQLICFRIFNAE